MGKSIFFSNFYFFVGAVGRQKVKKMENKLSSFQIC